MSLPGESGELSQLDRSAVFPSSVFRWITPGSSRSGKVQKCCLLEGGRQRDCGSLCLVLTLPRRLCRSGLRELG